MPIPIPILASVGLPGRVQGPLGSLVDVHIDAITGISQTKAWERTTVGLETGASLLVHRQRVPVVLTVTIVISDVEPLPLARFTPLWELGHAAKTRAKLEAAQGFDGELRVWDGTKYRRTPAGSEVWVLDSIEESEDAPEKGVMKATLVFGEVARFTTLFTAALVDVGAELLDVAGAGGDAGLQSTASVATVAGSFP